MKATQLPGKKYHALACSLALGLLAAASAFADETPLVWNGADGALWNSAETLNWLAGETPIAWTDGSSAIFGADTNVSLNGTVVVSNLTTEGSLRLDGNVVATYEGFVPKDAPALVFPGLTLADISGIWGEMGGLSMSGGSKTFSAYGYHYFPSNGVAIVQFQVYQGIIKCTLVKFTDGDGGVYAQGIGTRYVDNGSIKTLGMDLVSGNIADLNARGSDDVATELSMRGYGVCQLKAASARVHLTGAVGFGGAVSASNVETFVTAPISQTWTQSVASVNGRIVVKGLSGATVDKTFGITDPNVEKAAAQWMSTTAGGTVLTNLVLTRAMPVSAVMRGNAIGYNGAGTPYHVQFNGETMTFQLHHWASGIKGVKVELKQVGANVTARWVKGWWWDKNKGSTQDMMGCDLEAKQAELGTSVIANNTGSYGVKSLTLRTVDVPSLTFGMRNYCSDMLVDNAQMVFAGTNSVPTGDLVARNGASIVWLSPCGNGAGRLRLFESGSTLLSLCNMGTETQATYVFDASTLYAPMLHWSQKDGCSYFNYLTLRNGSRVIGNPLRCGFTGGSDGKMIYRSEGVGTNLLASGVNLVNNTSDQPNHLCLEIEADLVLSGLIRDYVDSTSDYSGSGIVKRGNATLTLSGTNTFIGRLTVEAGTLALASDGALPATAPLTLANTCSVTCGGVTNSTGALTLSGNATLALGDGALSFADSSGEGWKAGATLTVTGDGSLPTQALRFGASSTGLTAAQLKQITYNGEPVSLDSQGYLRHAGGLVISIF